MDKQLSIITMTMVKNEADIVETFVRYTMNFASKMVFIDNGCTDNTIEILKKLIAEGYLIEIYNEAHIFYEQYVIENKYLYKIANENICDFIIPLDADEFITAKKDVIQALSKLNKHVVTLINWKTYVLKSLEDCQISFLKSIRYVRIKESRTYTKTIIPYDIIKNNTIYLEMGHHDIESACDILKHLNDEIFIAHFPVRNKEQIQSKIYQGVISQLMSSYKKIIASHWRKLYQDMQNGTFDLISYSQNYALPEEEIINPNIDIQKEPINLKWCKNIECRYQDIAVSNSLENIFHMSEIMALTNLTKSNEKTGLNKIIIYGTGNTAKSMFRYIDEEDFNIVAFVDSDIQKEFQVFHNRLVISPKKIKFLTYDILVIASRYFEEIEENLRTEGIDMSKVRDKSYFISEKMKSI